MSAAVAIVCPACQKQLRVPPELLGKKVRCKGCGQAVATGGPPASAGSSSKQPALSAKAPALKQPLRPDDKASDPPIDAPALRPKVQAASGKSPARRGLPAKVVMPLVFSVVILAAAGGLFWLFQDDLLGLAAQVEAKQATRPHRSDNSLLAAANPTVSKPSAPIEQPKPTKPKPPPKNRPNYRGRIASPYPARALLIGVKNYLLLNPLNPGYREDAKNRDLLGLGAIAKALVEEHGLPFDQVAELSDVATRNNPFAPTKAAIEATLDDFLAKARPQDHAIVLIVAYATSKGDKGYLVPLDGDPERPETLIPIVPLLEKLKASPAGRKLLIAELSPLDAEQFPFRALPPPLTAKAAEPLTKPPAGVQVWLSAAPGQTARQYTGGGFIASVFLHQLAKKADLRPPENWALIDKDPAYRDGSKLPLTLLAPAVNAAAEKAVNDRSRERQTPLLYGTAGRPAAPADLEAPPAPAVTLKAPGQADLASLANLLRELPLTNDPMREVKPSFLPPFDPKTLAQYPSDVKGDFRSLDELKSKVKDQPLRLMAVEAATQLEKRDWRLTRKFRFNPNDAQFKKDLEREQQRPATLAADLADLYEQLKAAGELRKAEKSARWQAHYDLVTAIVLGKLITVQEHNFVLGNNLRKDSPTLKEPAKHNGWAIIPQEKLQQTETRALDKERRKILDRLIKERPGTPWELLARRELATSLGLTLKEARVEP